MSHRTSQIDQVVLSSLPNEKSRAVGIVDFYPLGARIGTVRAALKRLVSSGEVERAWDGNERYGRYVYWALGSNLPTAKVVEMKTAGKTAKKGEAA